jgi:flagellin
MSFRINTNIGALNAYNALAKANSDQQASQLRLASRKRINSVSDDVSGFNVGKALDSKVQLMNSAKGNIGSAKDMLSTAESALLLVKDKLTQIRTYVADASDATKDREALADNIKSLGEEIKNIFATTKFNDTNILMGATALSSMGGGKTVATATDDSRSKGLVFQTGSDVTDRINLDFASGLASSGAASGGYSTGTVSTAVSNAVSSFTSFAASGSAQDVFAEQIALLASFTGSTDNSKIGSFETQVDKALSKIGNFSQRLDVKDEYLTSAITNAQSTVSRLFDADMAMEQLNATKAQIGGQVATSMLGQLNFAPQNVLSLFG